MKVLFLETNYPDCIKGEVFNKIYVGRQEIDVIKRVAKGRIVPLENSATGEDNVVRKILAILRNTNKLPDLCKSFKNQLVVFIASFFGILLSKTNLTAVWISRIDILC